MGDKGAIKTNELVLKWIRKLTEDRIRVPSRSVPVLPIDANAHLGYVAEGGAA